MQIKNRIFIIFLAFFIAKTVLASPNIARSLAYGTGLGAVNFLYLVNKGHSDLRQPLSFAIISHASFFTALSASNLMAKSASARTMGVVFLPMAFAGNYLYLSPQKRHQRLKK